MGIYQIADLIVAMECQGRTRKQAVPYRYNGEKNVQIRIDSQKETAHFQSKIYTQMDEDEWEYMLTGSSFYSNLLDFDGMLLHASAVVFEDKAYLFSAPCGTGKSTHTSLWLKKFSNAYIINDDKPAIRLIDGKFYVYGTPWSGKSNLNVPTCVPLQGICFLQQDKRNWINLMDANKAIINFMNQTIHKLDQDKMNKLMSFIDLLISNIKIYEMGCRIDLEAVDTAYEMMKGENENES